MAKYTNNILNSLIKNPFKSKKVNNSVINTDAYGSSGTELYAGRFDEEYLSKLLADQGIAVYDQMRRSDGVVKMLLTAVKNPIKSANWTVNAVDGSDEEQEIAEFVEHILFKDIVSKGGKRKTFLDFIGEALTQIEFGFSAFEIVHKMVKGHKRFGDYIGLADLGFRHQRSIQEWILTQDGSIDYVRQLVNGDLGVDVLISGKNLLVFSCEKEGDNYEGISMLRPCYGCWWRKNQYRKFQAVGIERCSKGVPVGKMPEDLAGSPDYETQLQSFKNVIDKLSSNQTNGIVIGSGFDLTEMKLTHDAEKVQKAIDAEDVEMARAFIASFLVLGTSGNSGSFALGQDLSSIFLSGIQNIAYSMNEKINLQVIRPLVKAKYGERENYPELAVSGIADKAGTSFADIVNKLITAGAIQVSPALQRHVHNLLDLPEIDEDIADRDFSDNVAEDDSTIPPPPPAGGNSKKTKPTEKTIDDSMNEDNQKKNLSDQECGCGCGSVKLTEEQKASSPVSSFIEDSADKLAQVMRNALTDRSKAMLSDMIKIIKKGGSDSSVRGKIVKIKMPDVEKYHKDLIVLANITAQESLNNVVKELGIDSGSVKFASVKDKFKNLSNELKEKLTQLLLLTADYQDIDLEKAVYFSFNENFGRLDSEEVIAEMQRAVELQLEKKVIETAAVNVSTKIVNNVRESVFFAPEVSAQIESFVFQNPAPVSPICQSLVGSVFTKEEYNSTPYIPPLHHNCKSYITAQMVGSENNKPLTKGGLEITDPKILKSKTL